MLVVPGGAVLATCVADRQAPRAERYRCVVTPNNLVECDLVQQADEAAPR